MMVVRLVVGVALALVIADCGERCERWDPMLTVGATLDVELLEAYGPASTTALYSAQFGLTPAMETCGALDEIAVGRSIAVRLLPGPRRCAYWDAELLDPPLAIESGIPFLNNLVPEITVAGTHDFGGGCSGEWELLLHPPTDDPFAAQDPLADPVLLAYRVFRAPTDANEACSALVSRAPAVEPFSCGDVFVARMTRR